MTEPASDRFRRSRLWPVAVAVACVLLAFGRLLLNPGGWIVDAEWPGVDPSIPVFRRVPGNDLTRLFVPHHLSIAQALHATGGVPSWDPRGFGGRPLVGNPQAGLWYPPNWLVWITAEPALFGWITLGHLIGALVGLLVLTNSLGLRPWASAVAGVALVLNPYILAQVLEGHLPQVWAACWVPWILLSVRVWRRGDRRGGLAFAPLLALCALTGHPQVPYLLVVGLGAWLAAELFLARVRGRTNADTRGRLATVALLFLPVVLTAVSWLPVLLTEPWTLVRSRGQVAEADRYAVGVANLWQALDPLALGGPADYRGPGTYWESQIGVGGPVLLLAAAALAWGPRERRSLIAGLLLFWTLGVWLAAGRGLGLASVLGALVPGMGRFRVPGRVLFLVAPAVALLAALGVEALERRGRSGRWVAGVLGGLAMLHLAIEGFWIVKVAPASKLLEAGPAAGLLRDHGPDGPFRVRARDSVFPDLQAAVLGVEKTNVEDWFQIQHAADLYEVLYPQFDPPRPVEWLNPLNSWVLAQARQGVLDRMNVRRLICDTVPRGFQGRVLAAFSAFTSGAEHPAPPPWPSLSSGVGTMTESLPTRDVPTDVARLRDERSRIDSPPFEGEVKEGRDTPRALSTPTPPCPPSGRGERDMGSAARLNPMPLVGKDQAGGSPSPDRRTIADPAGPPAILILENPTALPRAYVVPRAVVASAGEDPALQLAWVDARTAVLMEHDPLAAAGGPRQPFTPAVYRAPDADHLQIDVETQAPGLLVVADIWMPGWSATVDGQPERVDRGDHAQRVVVLARAGRHTIAMQYVAPGLWAGAAISVAGAVGWTLLAARVWTARSKLRPTRGVCE
jgi:hypothetical protein